jgi:hypothetical protein
MDITEDNIPLCDMAIVKDVFIHLSLENIQKVLNNLKNRGITFLLSSCYVETEINEDKEENSKARPINLMKAPFNFGEPLERLWEEYNRGPFLNSRYLCLWRL